MLSACSRQRACTIEFYVISDSVYNDRGEGRRDAKRTGNSVLGADAREESRWRCFAVPV